MFDEKAMNAEEYIKQRLEDQIGWYDRKSKASQRMFKGLRLAEIILAALIPLVAGLTADSIWSWSTLTALLGASVAILAAVLALYQYQEHWIEYRTTSESLKKEKYLFLTKTEPYNGENAFETLVQRVETLVSKENTNWAQYMMKPDKGDKHGH